MTTTLKAFCHWRVGLFNSSQGVAAISLENSGCFSIGLLVTHHLWWCLAESLHICVLGKWGKTSVQTFSSRFLKTLIEGAVTTEAGSLFQYFTTLTENADHLPRRWLAPWSTLKGCPLRPRRAGGRKTSSDQYPKGPWISWINIQRQPHAFGLHFIPVRTR